jgi:hypothetical protein
MRCARMDLDGTASSDRLVDICQRSHRDIDALRRRVCKGRHQPLTATDQGAIEVRARQIDGASLSRPGMIGGLALRMNLAHPRDIAQG